MLQSMLAKTIACPLSNIIFSEINLVKIAPTLEFQCPFNVNQK